MRHSALFLAAALAAAPLTAQTDDGTTFRWSGTVARGHFIRLHNMNGDVRVERGAPGSRVEVIGERTVRRGDGSVVRFDVRMRDDGDVVVCALWGKDMTCTDEGARGRYQVSSWRGGDQVSVALRVRVPDGVKAYARSTNGGISVEGITAEVDAATTNGDVRVRTTSGVVNTATTNGSITATLGSSEGDAPMRFTTTNGTVTVFAPPTLSANLEMSTTNGELAVDFPVTVSGQLGRKQIRGTLGQGGRSIVVRSTNGDVSLRSNGI
jgi:translation initiation factor IF-1